MTDPNIPLWVEAITAFFVLAGAFVALLAASGVLRLNSFFARVHAPALVTTVGIWCILLATLIFFTAYYGKVPINTLLIGLFISVTTPVTTIFLMRAALFRSRQRGEDVPASVNMLKIVAPQKSVQDSSHGTDAAPLSDRPAETPEDATISAKPQETPSP
ncbi:multisubunit potassium/proton antiporter, PhaG subunit [Lampropedia hyalina DSM 16112]|jgi:multicomponent K+:H+ antiporter subunit G|uniref:Multisubunit potassium/proton antiporter, PhaG subunit n=1 Tax=Lampropedia hyalina DSM 16112 TaxID=1122156 RepID=A0A1M4ZNR4_9BURK|nr:monovalent cation/H(+) antiporter subunit G [Lampropedia hyalina]SHF19689.1 multisubunit potassium/proton antiporter, PhaG subunit [Lampropedia hyalina DSM 16112]